MRSVMICRCGLVVAILSGLVAPVMGQQQSATPPGQTDSAARQPSGNDMPMGPPRSSPPPQTTQGQTTRDQTTPAKSASGAQDTGNVDQGSFVFKKQVEEVVLHATVVDDDQRLVAHLDRSAFSVFEDGRPQTITSFRREDVPVEIGVVIDNSGSMRDKREKVNEAVLNLIRASNPSDEVFVVNFSAKSYLDQDFTSDIHLLERALHQTTMQGSTALYDAVVASARHLESNSRLEKKVLLLITDGQDNMSEETLQEATRELQRPNGPVLYAIGLTGGEMQAQGRDALEELARATGGAAFFPAGLDQVEDVTRSLAHDIRNQYIIAYRPQDADMGAGYHPIQVEAREAGFGKLTVRTRSGVYTGESVR
ncbi:MAG TPA: VWA domain-containing protein [Terriglobales bacterium]|nr:VWA domain-containing protein [Terriglobales bacterium]